MGIQDRGDHRQSQDASASSMFGGMSVTQLSPVVKYIILANILAFVLQCVVTRPVTLADLQGDMAGLDEAEFREKLVAERAAELEQVARTKGDDPRFSNISNAQWTAIAENELQQTIENQLGTTSVVEDWGVLRSDKVLQGQAWRLLTSSFLHSRDTLLHLLFNMLGLFWFGVALERMMGSREFLLFYFMAAIASSLAFVGLDVVTHHHASALGASGAVMGVLMLYAVNFPRQIIRINFFIPLQIRWFILICVIVDLYPVLLMLRGNSVSDGIAHAAHLGGLALGFFYGRIGWRWESLPGGARGDEWASKPPHHQLRIHDPGEDISDQAVE